jgi:RHS repeat-associated protein
LRYAGQYLDGESGLYYMRARYFDPLSMQFVTVDPLANATRQRYIYVSDSPVNTQDPSGLDDQSAQPVDVGWLMKYFSDVVGGYVRSSETLSSAAGKALATGGSAAAGRALRACDRLTPIAKLAGKFAPGVGLALTYAAAKQEGASDSRAAAVAIGATLGGVAGVESGAGICTIDVIATSGIGIEACPVVVVGLGVVGGFIGEAAGGRLSDWMHW